MESFRVWKRIAEVAVGRFGTTSRKYSSDHDLDARATMTQDVGLVKSDARLDRAGRRVEHIEKEVARYWMNSKPTCA